MKLEYKVNKNQKYQNLREIFKQEFHLSDRLITKLKKANQIYINKLPSPIYSSFKVGDIITVCLDFNELSDTIYPIKMKLEILFEDDALLIVNKPAGIPVHPSMEHFNDSLSNGVQYYFNKIGLQRKIRPVNRLDRNTSGIVVFAKNEYIQESLIYQMKTKDFQKEYIALLTGNLKEEKGTVSIPIKREHDSIIKRIASSDGASAITHYELLKNYPEYCLVKFILETGRTHQIRVHSQYIGHSILGDTLYGNPSESIERQALHAYKINFIHPITKKKLELIAEIPKDIKKLI